TTPPIPAPASPDRYSARLPAAPPHPPDVPRVRGRRCSFPPARGTSRAGSPAAGSRGAPEDRRAPASDRSDAYGDPTATPRRILLLNTEISVSDANLPLRLSPFS